MTDPRTNRKVFAILWKQQQKKGKLEGSVLASIHFRNLEIG